MALLEPQPIKQRYIPKHKADELSLQKQVCRYLDLHYPHVLYKSDYGSGLKLTMNQARVQQQLQSGRAWPDLTIFQPSRGFGALFIELKREGTTLYLKKGPRKGLLTSDPHIQEQAAMLQHLNKLGYFARFGVGFESCVRLISWYLDENYKQSENTELF